MKVRRGAYGQKPQSQADSPFTAEVVKLLRYTLNSDVGLWNSPTSPKEVSREDEMRKGQLRTMVSWEKLIRF